LSDLPLTPIPELLHTPTNPSMPITGPGFPELPSPGASALLSEQRHPRSDLPSPLESNPILEQLRHSEENVSLIRSIRIPVPRPFTQRADLAHE